MKQYQIHGQSYTIEIHQQDEQLPYLLMLHGFMGDRRVFGHLINELTAFCNPICLDLLGFGKSSKPSDPKRYEVKHQIKDIRQLINQLNCEPLILHGYSMGGRLALSLALQKPELFNGLVLESTNCGISNPKQRRQRQQLDATWAKQLTTNFDAFLSDWKELELFQSPRPIDEQLIQKYHHIQSEQSPKALSASLRGFGTGSMPAVCHKLPELELPTLLLAGSADEKYQQINNNLVDQLPNATFLSIEAGHRTHLDNPAAFVTKLRKYFNEHI